MATSVYSFYGVTTTATDLKSAELEIVFTPPSNIAGEFCYVECPAFTWRFNTALTVNSRDMFLVSSDWAQTVSGTVTTTSTKPGKVPLAAQMNNISYGTGPVLCYIPESSHPVRFTVTRVDGGVIATDTTSNAVYLVLKIVPANSRQPQIGV